MSSLDDEPGLDEEDAVFENMESEAVITGTEGEEDANNKVVFILSFLKYESTNERSILHKIYLVTFVNIRNILPERVMKIIRFF